MADAQISAAELPVAEHQDGPRVAIVLSTRNGQAYLEEQLASFLAQTHAAWHLYWRDDDSDDATPGLMRRFAEGSGAGRVTDVNDHAGRRGITGSFMELVRAVPAGQVVAFADQDDVWLPEKLARGVAALQDCAPGLPALYCARQMLVDSHLHHLKISPRTREAPSFPQAMTQNIATGCTVMLNAAAVSLLAASRPPPETLHDWWAYLMVTAAGGRVVVDREPTVLYRQHGRNAVGVPLSFGRRALAALGRGPGVFMRTFRAHLHALQLHGDLLAPRSSQELATIAAGLGDGWRLRLRALTMPGLRRQNWAETQLFRLWFLIG